MPLCIRFTPETDTNKQEPRREGRGHTASVSRCVETVQVRVRLNPQDWCGLSYGKKVDCDS